MIVYGDPSFEQPSGTLAARLREHVTAAASRATGAGGATLDLFRALLIEAGQLEQAGLDAAPRPGGGDAYSGVTDALARAFVAAASPCPGDARSYLVAVLAEVAGRLGPLACPDGKAVRVKVPEGFAFYTLYPEQYCAAAERWVAAHAAERDGRLAVVVGVRSIGTSLSAVVAAVLARAGWATCRLTVRPTGHPYARHVDLRLPASVDPSSALALVVDEGPGHSGSSMAAAAQALANAGIGRRRISFFPGHPGPPGHAASEAVRAWWDATPRHVVTPDDLRWGGLSLREVLSARAADLVGRPVARIEDLGGGAWRRQFYADPAQWPAAYAPFERSKYLCAMDGGGAVLWKFAGLAAGADGRSGADAAVSRVEALAGGGWTARPLGSAMGFVATPWVNGQPLTRADATPDVLAHVGRYVAVAGMCAGMIDTEQQRAGHERLAEMLYWNTRESLGEEAALRTRQLADAARAAAPGEPVPAYGDGRLAPHEWLRTADGRILKTDAAGHDADHTVVGRQPVAWDLAGAMVEWGLGEVSSLPLVDAFRAAGGGEIPRESMSFHLAAYAAFRVGMSSMCADMSGKDPDERGRLRAAESFYRDRLQRLTAAR
jgi:hypothetical protein